VRLAGILNRTADDATNRRDRTKGMNPIGTHFFASYSRKDELVVRQLLKLVTVSGGFAFLDQDGIVPGADWRSTLVGAIAEADALLVFWSTNASRSTWVRREWQLGLELQKRVIPVQLDSTPMPRQLSWLQAIDLRVLVPIQGMVHKSAYYSLLKKWEPEVQEMILRMATTKLTDELLAFSDN